MTYEQAKEIVEWTARAETGEIMLFRPHEIMTALAIMVLARESTEEIQ